MMQLSILPILLFGFPFAYGHGRVTNVTTSTGTVYTGWDAALPAGPPLAAWSASNLGNIFVPPSSFNTSNITCHFDAKPGALHVNITAGDILKLAWNEWPTSHKGPVLSYLASCGESCENANKEQLEWVKIDELGWLNGTGWAALGGTWATDVLIINNFSWMVKIPELLAPGSYVLRHEILALHVADKLDGLQAYPQCLNLRVASNETARAGRTTRKIEGGITGAKLYGEKDKGILVDIHGNVTQYDIPGPKLWNWANHVKQAHER